MPLYKPCPFCRDRGCLACDHERVNRIKLQALEQEARQFLTDVAKGTEYEGRQPNDDMLKLIMQAIEHGKELVRRKLRVEDVKTADARFAMLEFEVPPQDSENETSEEIVVVTKSTFEGKQFLDLIRSI